MQQRFRKILCLIFLIAIAVGLLSGMAQAADVSYIVRTYDETNNVVTSSEGSTSDYTTVNSDITAWTDGWYVVDSNVTISSRITVEGEVNLILCDGATLTASQGINVASGNTLNIYGQTGDTGKLVARGIDNAAGIGGGGDEGAGGTVTINFFGN